MRPDGEIDGSARIAAPRDLEAELVAERRATDHWRRIARQRDADYARLRHRPLVHALLGVERRLAPARGSFARAGARARGVVPRLALTARAIAAAPARRHPGEAALRAELRALPEPEGPPRRVTLIEVGSRTRDLRDMIGDELDVAMVHVGASEPVTAVRRAIEAADTDLVGVVLATTEPLDRSWLARLAAPIGGDVAAATPLLVHPLRAIADATPHDGRVRSAGLALDVSAAGFPVVRARASGTAPDPKPPPEAVVAGSAACLVVDRAGYLRVGGLPPANDLEVAIVELCVNMRARGGRAVLVPGSVMVDARPARSLAELRTPIDPASPAWRGAIDRSGPALLRATRTRTSGASRFALTVAAPSAKVATQWGDWHLAVGLAAGLRRRGHPVRVQTADRADDPAGRVADVHLVLRGLAKVRRTEGQRHVLWIISHPETIEDDELDAADLVLVASPRFAEHLRARTATPVEVFLQATDHRRFAPQPRDTFFAHPITVVANTRDVLRPAVADALRVGLRPAIYGSGWRALVDPTLIVSDHIDNETLPLVYSSAGVVLNDHWRTMQAWGFVSNRVFDVLACGAPLISDPVPGIADLFDGAVLEYGDPGELRALVDEVVTDHDRARARVAQGRAAVLAHHTFDTRARELTALLAKYRCD